MKRTEIKRTIELLRYYANRLATQPIPGTVTPEQESEIIARLKRIMSDVWKMEAILEKTKVPKNGSKTKGDN